MADDTKKDFESYLGSEYKNIAEAHFRTMETISSFFRYYLLIMSAPITVVVVFININSTAFLSILAQYRILVAVLLLGIAAVGYLVMRFIINLRMDAVMYARTINAIRKHYYDLPLQEVDLAMKLSTRVLPQSPHLPRYKEWCYFGPVIFSFCIFDSFYLWCGFFLLMQSIGNMGLDITSPPVIVTETLILLFVSTVTHSVTYSATARYREREYLKSLILGVDIDGVLNEHRTHFCDILNTQRRETSTLSADDITTIPLHDCAKLAVSRAQEAAVFNDTKYWINMPPIPEAASALSRARHLNIKVYIFTHRPWPSTGQLQKTGAGNINAEWKSKAQQLISSTKYSCLDKVIDHIRLFIGITEGQEFRYGWYRIDRLLAHGCYLMRRSAGSSPIEIITKLWLYNNNFNFDYLLIERGSEYVVDPVAKINNRFQVSMDHKIRYFVEDDIEKAVKLSYICDVVFLLEHPYNTTKSFDRCQTCDEPCRKESPKLPANVQRVTSWDEIYRKLRRFS